jgi:tungstate transport system ATP-binding protein
MTHPTPTPPTIYHLRDVVKSYNGRRVLAIEELDIQAGEVLALVGPSGAGKSTLLRLLNFLESPSSGSLAFHGQEFEVPLAMRRRVTTVFQRPMLLNRSVWDNVAFGLNLRGQRSQNAAIQSALKAVGLESLARQRARTLSGGEAQRVALARAIVLHPEVLLMDEPTANLDPYNIGIIEDIAANLNREQGTTLVLVTHNIFQAKRLASRVAFMLEGQIVETAGVQSFFEKPSDERTAAFVRGDMVY